MLKSLSSNSRGISLVGVLISMALAGGLALLLAQISKNSTDISVRSFAAQEELDLIKGIELILSDPRYCGISLVDGVPFRKRNVDGVDNLGNPNSEGIDVELWLSDTDGFARTKKKYNGEDNPGTEDKSDQGKITIRSMRLVMNNSTGINYPNNPAHWDVGELHVQIGKRSSSKTIMEKSLRAIPVRIQMESSGGNSTILACSQSLPLSPTDSEKYVDVWASNFITGHGSGNLHRTFKCPDDSGIAAVNVKTGSEWDSIQFLCRDITGSYSQTQTSPRYGGTGGAGPAGGFSNSRCRCPNQGFIASIYMYTGSEIDGLGGDCINSSFTVLGSFGRCGRHNGGGFGTKSTCPPNSIANGALLRYSSGRVRSVKLLCTQKATQLTW